MYMYLWQCCLKIVLCLLQNRLKFAGLLCDHMGLTLTDTCCQLSVSVTWMSEPTCQQVSTNQAATNAQPTWHLWNQHSSQTTTVDVVSANASRIASKASHTSVSREAAVTAAARGWHPPPPPPPPCLFFLDPSTALTTISWSSSLLWLTTVYSLALVWTLQQLVVVRATFARFSGLDRREETEQWVND